MANQAWHTPSMILVGNFSTNHKQSMWNKTINQFFYSLYTFSSYKLGLQAVILVSQVHMPDKYWYAINLPVIFDQIVTSVGFQEFGRREDDRLMKVLVNLIFYILDCFIY